MRPLAVVGTDTGVGKTVVAAAIVRLLRARGIDAVGMKPFATGCRRTDGGLRSPDADSLAEAAGGAAPYDEIAPCRWEPPVSPLAAGATEADVERAETAFRRLVERHAAVVVEGIGGVRVPITRTVDVAGIAAGWGLEAVVVGRLGLGTLNHSLLTVEALAARGVPVRGIVLSEVVPRNGDPSAASNPVLLADLAGVPVLGVVPHGAGARAEAFVDLRDLRP